MIKAIIFDFDGTITDSFEQVVESYNSAAKKFGTKQVSVDDYKIVRNNSLKALVSEFKISRWKIPFLAFFTRLSFHKRVSTLEAFLGMNELLHKVSEEFEIYIASSNSERNLEKFLANNPEIKKSIKKVYGDRNPFNKHNMILKLLKENNLEKDDVIYVGDEIRDAEACEKIGVKIIGVTWGFSSREMLIQKLGENMCADHPTMLWKMLHTINNQISEYPISG